MKFVNFIIFLFICLNVQAQSFFTGYEGLTEKSSKEKIIDTINQTKKEEYKLKIISLTIEKDSLDKFFLEKDFIFNKLTVQYQKELIKKPSKDYLRLINKYNFSFRIRDSLKHIRKKNLLEYPTIAELNKGNIDKLSIVLSKLKDSLRYFKKMPTEQVKNELNYIQNKQEKFKNFMNEKLKRNKYLNSLYRDSLLLLFKRNHKIRYFCKLEKRPKNLSMAFQFPLRNKLIITSDYGYRNHPISKKKHFHSGIDFRGKEKSVYSILPGFVSKVGYHKKLGIYIEVTHKKGLKTTYGHLSKFYVLEETIIDLKKPIGLTGSTGNSTAPHLHFSAKLNNKNINPKFLLNGL
ncbi:M23 family metallopeptidase [Tenacibaculum finnmarkense]|uniref:M23 family metallopeptidase n=1 Tax=Tenacibaculum finnmarkense TaxID=2781243 RepID=UPI001EFB8459|nr:M23 family metallopeptidase [Tenacibaculum finnmarkense]MCG8226372.1 M23 family metallopeptidase [Tenacibaculum finnmarkense genomovar finnmarkense]